jgi:hypothetical protein
VGALLIPCGFDTVQVSHVAVIIRLSCRCHTQKTEEVTRYQRAAANANIVRLKRSSLGVAFGSRYRDELVVRLGNIIDRYFCLQKGKECARVVGRRGFLFVRHLVCFDDYWFWQFYVPNPAQGAGLFVSHNGFDSIV